MDNLSINSKFVLTLVLTFYKLNSKTTTITPVLWSRKDKDKLHPIKLRFTEDRKSTYINVGWSVNQKDWSNSKHRVKTTHKDHIEINYEIDKLVKQYEGQIRKTGQVKRSKIMVFNYLKELIKRQKFSSRKRYNTLLRHLMNFWGSETLYFYEIDEGFLYDFKSHLEQHIIPNNNSGLPSSNTVVNYLGVLNSTINTSIKEGVFFGENPFHKITIPQKSRSSSLKTLTKDDIWLLDNLHPDSPSMTKMMWNSLNVFMFCFWSQGLRISDCLELVYGDFTDGFFHINMRKTKRRLKFPLTEKNIVRLIPFIDEIPPFYNWELEKFISTDLDKGIIDGDYIGFGRPTGGLTPEVEILGGWNGYQKDRKSLYKEMNSQLEKFNNKRQQDNRVDYYFDSKWTMYSREYHNVFRKESNDLGQFHLQRCKTSKELYTKLCIRYFIEYTRKPENKNKLVFPFLRGLETDFTDKRWNKMSASTALINKYLKKISDTYGISHFSTHSSRHTFTSISIDLGADIYDIKEWLGHASVKITEGYISSIDTTRLEKHTNRIRDFLSAND